MAGLTDEVEALRKAVSVMIVVPKAADDMMNVGRLQGFDVSDARAPGRTGRDVARWDGTGRGGTEGGGVERDVVGREGRYRGGGAGGRGDWIDG